MKNILIKTVMFAALFVSAGFLFGQSPNLKGKAMAAANDCIQSFSFPGGGLQMVTSVEVVGTCPDGSDKYAVNIMRVGHCPGNNDILCLVIAMPVATVTFDCNENVQSIVCFN
jgi:hypothetical protein